MSMLHAEIVRLVAPGASARVRKSVDDGPGNARAVPSRSGAHGLQVLNFLLGRRSILNGIDSMGRWTGPSCRDDHGGRRAAGTARSDTKPGVRIGLDRTTPL